MRLFAPHQGRRQFVIKTPRHHADSAGAHFFGFLAGGIDLCFEQIMCDVAGLDFLHLFHLLGGHVQGVADMGVGVGLVALLLGDAGDIGLVEALQPRQTVAIKSNTGEHKAASP